MRQYNYYTRHFRDMATIFFALVLILSACGRDTAKGENADKTSPLMEIEKEGDATMAKESTGYVPAKTIGPSNEATVENLLAGAVQSYENVCDSYARMQELAVSDSASEKGKEAAAKVEEEYADRIAELAKMDFSQLSSEELLSISLECTDMISAIRKARDVLNTA